MATEKVLGLLNIVLTFLETMSVTSVLSLSVERLFSVAFPLWHRVKMTTRVTRYWLAAVWLFHLTWEGLLFVLLLYDYRIQWTLCKLFFMWVTFLLIQIMYFASYASLRKQRNELYKRQDLSQASIRMTKTRLESEKNFLITIAIVCFVLALTLLPPLTATFVHILLDSVHNWTAVSISKEPKIVWGATVMTLNFGVNGLIYLWRMKKYRKTFKKLYCNLLNT